VVSKSDRAIVVPTSGSQIAPQIVTTRLLLELYWNPSVKQKGLIIYDVPNDRCTTTRIQRKGKRKRGKWQVITDIVRCRNIRRKANMEER